MISNADYTSFINKQIYRTNYIRDNVKNTQDKKLDKLKRTKFEKLGFKYNEEWFRNMTEYNLPMECKWLLSLGKKFALPINRENFSIVHVIADMEQYIQTMNNNVEKDIARTKLANKITQFKRNMINTEREKFIQKIFGETKKFLKIHKDIVITQVDKGNKTIMMYRNEYENKMSKLLEDKNTYRTIRLDPTIKLQKENNKIVTELHKSGLIDTWQRKKLSSSSAIAPRIYGLPKIHKKDIPLRPIVSSTNVPCYNLSKYMGNILKMIVSREYNLKNSMQLKEKMLNNEIEKDEILVSFDVVSLFTNIPVHLAIKNIMEKWNILTSHTKINKSTFLKILNFCLNDNNYFNYEGIIYNQIHGMPMGNPLSPTIADIVLDNLLDNVLEELKVKGVQIKFIAKYVDDMIAIIKEKDKDTILSALNNYHKKIQFTIETEENQRISYLDAMLHRNNNKIQFDWYTKEMASGRMMNFYTTQPKSQIINTATSFVKRVLNISDEQFHEKNIMIVEEILRRNCFPQKVIKYIINNTKHQLGHDKRIKDSSNKENKQFYSVSYIPSLTEKRCIRKIIDLKNSSFAYIPNRTISSVFTKTKTCIDKKQQSNVVYEIKCKGDNNNNCNKIYIGTTKRTLNTRIEEHKMDITKQKETTALAKHILQTGHSADLENVKILDLERNERKRYTLETLRIQQKIERTINLKEDTADINLSYKVALS